MSKRPNTDTACLLNSYEWPHYILIYDPYTGFFVKFNDKGYIIVDKEVENLAGNTTLDVINTKLNSLDINKDIYFHMAINPTLYRHNNVYNPECSKYERIIITPICLFGISNNYEVILSIINYNPNYAPYHIYDNKKKIYKMDIKLDTIFDQQLQLLSTIPNIESFKKILTNKLTN